MFVVFGGAANTQLFAYLYRNNQEFESLDRETKTQDHHAYYDQDNSKYQQVFLSVMVFWVVKQCSIVGGFQHFRETSPSSLGLNTQNSED
jgi:hypothetical protein